MRIEYFAQTDVGKVRAENQDCYGFSESANLYFVCDGMGGGAAGDFASRCAASVITHAFTHLTVKEVLKIDGAVADSLTDFAMRLTAAIRLSNRALQSLADKYSKLAGMGTTVAAILFEESGDIAHIYHVGDSRIYRLHNGFLELLTKDHSKINELLDQGKMKSDDVKTAEIQSMITRALGTSRTVKIDYRRLVVMPDDCFILCSDGLNGEIEDAEIGDIMSANKDNLEGMVSGLIEAANNAGGKDNTTVIGVHATGEADRAYENERDSAVVTVPDETPDQLSYEDSLVKDIIAAAHIKLPKSARDTSLYSHPVILSVLFLALLLGAGYMVTHTSKRGPDTALKDLSGTVTGVQLFVRTPTAEQLALFKNAGDDTIQKLQIFQDWLREPNRLTEPLESVQMIVLSNEKEEFNGISNANGTDIKMPRGVHWLTLYYPAYSIITEKLERRDTVPVTVESAAALKPMTVIMLPAD
jgi:serine/threonine protein phosphatase PrpC